MRYYLPPDLMATTAALIDSWRSGGDRRMIITAAASTASTTALTAYLVRSVNLRLLQDEEPLRHPNATDCSSPGTKPTWCAWWRSLSPR